VASFCWVFFKLLTLKDIPENGGRFYVSTNFGTLSLKGKWSIIAYKTICVIGMICSVLLIIIVFDSIAIIIRSIMIYIFISLFRMVSTLGTVDTNAR